MMTSHGHFLRNSYLNEVTLSRAWIDSASHLVLYCAIPTIEMFVNHKEIVYPKLYIIRQQNMSCILRIIDAIRWLPNKDRLSKGGGTNH